MHDQLLSKGRAAVMDMAVTALHKNKRGACCLAS